MQTIQPISQLISRIWNHISLRRRWQFGLLLILMIITSFAEIISIGSVLPFLGILTSPERVFNHSAAQPIIKYLGLTSSEQLLLPLTIIFCLAAIISAAMRLFLLWGNTRLSFVTGADLSISIYRRTLYQPYAVHCSRNSSEIINGISTKTGIAIGTLHNLLNIISSFIMLVGILVVLMSVEPLIALAAFGGFGLIYASIIKLSEKRLLLNSTINARESTNIIKSLQEGLGGIRDVLIDGSQDTYCQIYTKSDRSFRRAQCVLIFITQCPRYIMEGLGMLLIAMLAYILAKRPDGIANAIPILGALAMGAQRLLPVLQQGYGAWSSIKGTQASLQDTLDLLDQPLPIYVTRPSNQILPFNHQIKLNQLSFRYGQQLPYVLKQININICKGSRVGFVGTTGSGKSTLLDIVMGLLQPTDGSMEIDGVTVDSNNQRAWQAHIAHVPQTIFLADSSVEENIAFGVPQNSIVKERVLEAAKQAQISDFIETLPDKYQTCVGEKGVRLSGGQRQRIGIARALYKRADVIIFDEATSALDNDTEQAVIQAIDSLSKNLTLLIIAHRLTTLKNCTMIVELSDGNVKQIGTYAQMMGGHQIGQNSLKKVSS